MARKLLTVVLGDIGGPRQSPTRLSQLIRGYSRNLYAWLATFTRGSKTSNSRARRHRGTEAESYSALATNTRVFSQLIRLARNFSACLENSITRARRQWRTEAKSIRIAFSVVHFFFSLDIFFSVTLTRVNGGSNFIQDVFVHPQRKVAPWLPSGLTSFPLSGSSPLTGPRKNRGLLGFKYRLRGLALPRYRS